MEDYLKEKIAEFNEKFTFEYADGVRYLKSGLYPSEIAEFIEQAILQKPDDLSFKQILEAEYDKVLLEKAINLKPDPGNN